MLSAWVKIASTNTVGEKSLALLVDSIDESTAANASILVNVLSDGFTVPASVYVDGALSTVQKLNFDTPYLLTLSSATLYGASILFGANTAINGGFLDAKYAFIELHRGYTYSANEVSDLFGMRRSTFGK